MEPITVQFGNGETMLSVSHPVKFDFDLEADVLCLTSYHADTGEAITAVDVNVRPAGSSTMGELIEALGLLNRADQMIYGLNPYYVAPPGIPNVRPDVRIMGSEI